MSKDILDVLSEAFQSECKVINLKYEYEGYTGREQWAIITELSEKELFEKYPDTISHYIPFVLLSVEEGKAVYDFRRNESKFYKCSLNNEDAFGYDDELTGIFHSEVVVPGFVDSEYLLHKVNHGLKKALGLWVDKPSKHKGDIRCLCPACLQAYRKTHNYIVRRLDPLASKREKCDKCDNMGWDYIIYERRTSADDKEGQE